MRAYATAREINGSVRIALLAMCCVAALMAALIRPVSQSVVDREAPKRSGTIKTVTNTGAEFDGVIQSGAIIGTPREGRTKHEGDSRDTLDMLLQDKGSYDQRDIQTENGPPTKSPDDGFRDLAALAYKAGLSVTDEDRALYSPEEYMHKVEKICRVCAIPLRHFVDIRGGSATTQEIYEYKTSTVYAFRLALGIANGDIAEALHTYEMTIFGRLLDYEEAKAIVVKMNNLELPGYYLPKK